MGGKPCNRHLLQLRFPGFEKDSCNKLINKYFNFLGEPTSGDQCTMIYYYPSRQLHGDIIGAPCEMTKPHFVCEEVPQDEAVEEEICDERNTKVRIETINHEI